MNGLNFMNLGASSAGASSYSGMILIVLMLVLMYFFMIRPQQKQRKEHQDMMSKLHKGDEVVTIGRMHGIIESINQEERTVTLDCEGIYLTFDLVAIARVVKPAADKNDADKTTDSAKEAPKKEEATDAPSSDTKESLSASSDDEASEASSDDEKPASSADNSEK